MLQMICRKGDKAQGGHVYEYVLTETKSSLYKMLCSGIDCLQVGTKSRIWEGDFGLSIQHNTAVATWQEWQAWYGTILLDDKYLSYFLCSYFEYLCTSASAATLRIPSTIDGRALIIRNSYSTFTYKRSTIVELTIVLQE